MSSPDTFAPETETLPFGLADEQCYILPHHLPSQQSTTLPLHYPPGSHQDQKSQSVSSGPTPAQSNLPQVLTTATYFQTSSHSL